MARKLVLTGLDDWYRRLKPHQLALYHGIPLEFAEKLHASGAREIPVWWPVYQNIFSIGGKGSGKTFAGAYTIARLAMNTPGGQGMVVRKRHEQLRNTFLAEFYNVLDLISDNNKDALVIKEGEKDGAVEVTLRTIDPQKTCKLIFRIEPEGDDRTVADSFKSYNLNFFLIEEASQLRAITFQELNDRLRDPKNPVRRGFVLSNPTTKSHWLSQMASKFEQQALAYNPRMSDDPTHNVRPEALVIRSKMTDLSDVLPADYIESVKRQYANDPVKYDMFINGLDGIDVEGKPVFSGHFVRDRHVDRSLRFNPERPLIRGWDFGYQNPACVFLQTDDQGGCNVLAEFRANEVYIEEFVDAVKAFTVRHMPLAGQGSRQIFDYGDHAGTQQTDKEHTTIQRAQMRGVHIVTRPNTQIERGLDVIRKLMAESRKVPSLQVDHTSGMILERPRFRIHPRCEELIDAIAYGYHYQLYKSGQLGNLPKKDNKYDHIVDALRYAVINTFGLADDAVSGNVKPVKAKRGKTMYKEW